MAVRTPLRNISEPVRYGGKGGAEGYIANIAVNRRKSQVLVGKGDGDFN
jgi:hypothetical protein